MTRDYILGAALGVGIAATGFYFYKKNQDKIDELLRSHGMDIPVKENKPLKEMSLEELATMKEKIEDMIAEKELSDTEEAKADAPKPAKKAAKRAKKVAKPEQAA